MASRYINNNTIKMVKNNKKILLIFVLLFVNVLVIQLISSAASYCCERTTEGAWCQNADQSECDANYKLSPTSCESTSYCKMGCCYDSKDGTCMENTPQNVCDDSGGYWSGKSAECGIPQCTLGCCLIGNQAAFVTQTRCSHLSAVYGLQINYRTDITDEVTCIASATSDVLGACVFEKDYAKTCLLTTQEECYQRGAGTTGSDVEFHEGYLCSAEELGADCGPSKQTTCVEGRDEVFFKDTCGNIANVYDASKINDVDYWTYIAGAKTGVDVTCGSDGSADSATCGNCDYYEGSTCKAYKRGDDSVRPTYGDYICRDLGCTYDSNGNGKIDSDEHFEHGETWCAEAKGVSTITVSDDGNVESKGEDLPGGRYFRLACYNGEVTIEPCADYRQEVCLQSDVNGFRTAACKVNRWQDCTGQTSQGACEDSSKRDCKWLGAGATSASKEIGSVFTLGLMAGGCVPLNAPGFNFWGEETEGSPQQICSSATFQCEVTYEKSFFGSGFKEKCINNCECDPESKTGSVFTLYNQFAAKCEALGDCGGKVNYLGTGGGGQVGYLAY
jgi:hypothetical protein